MAFWQALKGVLTRSTPEWYLDRLAFIGGTSSGGAGQSTVILWNNSSPPSNFYVYRQEVFVNPAQAGIASGPIAQQIGFLLNGAFPVLLNGAAAPGQAYSFNSGNPDTQILGGNLGGYLPNNGQLIWDSHFPLCVIPPNMGWLVTCNVAGTVQLAVNWWYIWK